jgi:hypothetical protein
MSSAFTITRLGWAPTHALVRVLLNTLIAYTVVAIVTFMSLAVALLVAPASVFIPSEYGPLLGGTIYVTGVLAFGLPIVIAGSAVLDYVLQPRPHPRRVVAALAVVQAAFWYATSHGEAPMLAAWTPGRRTGDRADHVRSRIERTAGDDGRLTTPSRQPRSAAVRQRV